MPVTWQADPRRKVPRVVLGGPDAIFRHLYRCEPKPLRAGSAVNIPVEPGVVDKNLQAAADEEDDEKEIDDTISILELEAEALTLEFELLAA